MTPRQWSRPDDPAWPSNEDWATLKTQVGGRLIELESPLAACRIDPDGAACAEALARVKNPYWTGDQPALTQASGWLDAWASAPSTYAVAATNTEDVAAAVRFARARSVRVVVKGGGHSYHGASNGANSLLIWTRAMNRIELHDAFVPEGGGAGMAPQPAVSIGAGAIWKRVYDVVTTRAGRYVQGGGCMTVGVAGLIQSGGFGSFSKGFGLAAAGLLEAEVVTADGEARIVNAQLHPDLFWALKGGGGGTFGVVTRLTLRVRELPATIGTVSGRIRASSDGAFRRLSARILSFYAERLFNSHWGEQIGFEPDNSVRLSLVFQGLRAREAEEAWRPLFEWVAATPDVAWERPPIVDDLPARHVWDAAYLSDHDPGRIIRDDRPGARDGDFLWAGNLVEAGQFFHGYHSTWLPATLLEDGQQAALADSIVAASRHWGVTLHFNKGLAGAPADEIAAARETATNPAAADAFALAVVIAEGPPAYRDMPGQTTDLIAARREAAAVQRAADELIRLVPNPGSYWSESDFFIRDWQAAFWGSNYPRLLDVKRKYDPDGLFTVHHGVGSEDQESR